MILQSGSGLCLTMQVESSGGQDEYQSEELKRNVIVEILQFQIKDDIKAARIEVARRNT